MRSRRFSFWRRQWKYILGGASLSFANSDILSLVKGKKTGRKSRAPTLKQLKEDFMDEMRYLSKLRHPCVTTVMGALIDKGDDPMVSVFHIFDQNNLQRDGGPY